MKIPSQSPVPRGRCSQSLSENSRRKSADAQAPSWAEKAAAHSRRDLRCQAPQAESGVGIWQALAGSVSKERSVRSSDCSRSKSAIWDNLATAQQAGSSAPQNHKASCFPQSSHLQPSPKATAHSRQSQLFNINPIFSLAIFSFKIPFCH